MTLYPKKTKVIIALVVSSIFTAFGICMGIAEGWPGYVFAGVGIIGVLITVIELLPGSSYLHIGPEGFTICSFYRKFLTPWDAVDKFFVVSYKLKGTTTHNMVGFNYVPSYEGPKMLSFITKTICDCEGGLADNYGMEVEELADLMNSFLKQHKNTKQNT